MPENPGARGQVDLGDVESIQNLDTARMALRWALERLRTLDKAQREAQVGLRSLERDALLRAAQAAQTELFRAKLEVWLLGRLSESPDTGGMREALLPRLAQLQADAAARRAALESETQKGSRAGAPPTEIEECRRALERLRAQERRLAHWEGLIAENDSLLTARGALAEKMRGLKSSLAEEAAPGSSAKPTEAKDDELVRIEALETLRAQWRDEKAALEAELRRREELIVELKGQLTSSPGQSSIMPVQLTRALAEKFSVMLSSWEQWEDSRRKALEEEREVQRRTVAAEMGKAEAEGRDAGEILAQARRRILEEAAKAQAAAAEEFRAMLQGWEFEHAARRRALEEKIELDRARLAHEAAAHERAVQEAGSPEGKAVVEELRRRLETQEAHYKSRLRREKAEAEAALQARAQEEETRRKAWEVSAELERRRLQEELDAQRGKADELGRREAESRLAQARLSKEIADAVGNRDVEERARLKALEDSWAEERSKLAADSAALAGRAKDLERRVEEQHSAAVLLQEKLAAEIRARETDRQAAEQALAAPRAAPASAPAAAPPPPSPAMPQPPVAAASVQPQAPAVEPTAAPADKEALLKAREDGLATLARRLEEEQQQSVQRLAEQQREFDAVNAKLAEVREAYMKELAQWEKTHPPESQSGIQPVNPPPAAEPPPPAPGT